MLLPGWLDFDKKINSSVLTVRSCLVSIYAVEEGRFMKDFCLTAQLVEIFLVGLTLLEVCSG